jgi:hypothetical protein
MRNLPTTVFFPRRTSVVLVSFAVSRQTSGKEGKSVEAVMVDGKAVFASSK